MQNKTTKLIQFIVKGDCTIDLAALSPKPQAYLIENIGDEICTVKSSNETTISTLQGGASVDVSASTVEVTPALMPFAPGVARDFNTGDDSTYGHTLAFAFAGGGSDPAMLITYNEVSFTAIA